MPIQTQTEAAADPTADVPQAESDLTQYLLKQINSGVPHATLMKALLINFEALANVHDCCTHSAGRAALNAGGRLIAAATGRPANTHLH